MRSSGPSARARRATRVSASAFTFATASTSAPARPMIAAADGVGRRMGIGVDAVSPPAPEVDGVLVAAAATTRAFQAEQFRFAAELKTAETDLISHHISVLIYFTPGSGVPNNPTTTLKKSNLPYTRCVYAGRADIRIALFFPCSGLWKPVLLQIIEDEIDHVADAHVKPHWRPLVRRPLHSRARPSTSVSCRSQGFSALLPCQIQPADHLVTQTLEQGGRGPYSAPQKNMLD
ncbi:hypothetical protein EDB92DRAFT_95123 [Lactarius akahatsu]|uniref:Uncharacterized protein n=1 Tax=Lactarius akahatsu TaxID=416441 RepID=A0AAD4QIF0_9AGAM|nr:hypothetical protein EDB92DRAFT_95123 [Lactarius akahatsu]